AYMCGATQSHSATNWTKLGSKMPAGSSRTKWSKSFVRPSGSPAIICRRQLTVAARSPRDALPAADASSALPRPYPAPRANGQRLPGPGAQAGQGAPGAFCRASGRVRRGAPKGWAGRDPCGQHRRSRLGTRPDRAPARDAPEPRNADHDGDGHFGALIGDPIAAAGVPSIRSGGPSEMDRAVSRSLATRSRDLDGVRIVAQPRLRGGGPGPSFGLDHRPALGAIPPPLAPLARVDQAYARRLRAVPCSGRISGRALPVARRAPGGLRRRS